jgi:hypothetical protein
MRGLLGTRKKISKMETKARAEIDLRLPAKRKRFQIIARNRMTSASGFTWFAREPELIFGAEGRASSQRSTEYHSASLNLQEKNRDVYAVTASRFTTGPAGFASRSGPLLLVRRIPVRD